MDHLRSGSGGDGPVYGPEPAASAVRRKDGGPFHRLLYLHPEAYDVPHLPGIQLLSISTDPFDPQVKQGYGRQLADFLKPTYMFQLDFDHVKKGEDPTLRQNLNNQNIGNVMKRLGFKKIHKKNGNGWAVIEKEGSEINNDAFIDPNDTVED